MIGCFRQALLHFLVVQEQPARPRRIQEGWKLDAVNHPEILKRCRAGDVGKQEAKEELLRLQ